MPSLLAGHQHGARGSAYRRTGVKLCETAAYSRHPIQVRRRNQFLAITSEVTVAEIVGQNEDHVGLSRWLSGNRPQDEEETRNKRKKTKQTKFFVYFVCFVLFRLFRNLRAHLYPTAPKWQK